ncbi:IS3 family transposase [Donghicola sp. XS_ASV15]|uniref:IS3 family transposase n=1 Tax=Donghicola sp. XS_ASV15 TaxID=3241295 RepID=UPI00351743AE
MSGVLFLRAPSRASARAKSDASLCLKIEAIWEENRKLYGARKILHVWRRDSEGVARYTVERLMKVLGIRGVVRGKKVVTTNPDTSKACPDVTFCICILWKTPIRSSFNLT